MFTTNTVENTLTEDTQRENHAAVMKPAAFAANFVFQYEMLWFNSLWGTHLWWQSNGPVSLP